MIDIANGIPMKRRLAGRAKAAITNLLRMIPWSFKAMLRVQDARTTCVLGAHTSRWRKTRLTFTLWALSILRWLEAVVVWEAQRHRAEGGRNIPKRSHHVTDFLISAKPAEVRLWHYWWNLIWNFFWSLKFPMGKIWWNFGGELFYLPAKHKKIGANFGTNFGANFGENYGNFVSKFTTFFGNFIQQKGGAKTFWRLRLFILQPPRVSQRFLGPLPLRMICALPFYLFTIPEPEGGLLQPSKIWRQIQRGLVSVLLFLQDDRGGWFLILIFKTAKHSYSEACTRTPSWQWVFLKAPVVELATLIRIMMRVVLLQFWWSCRGVAEDLCSAFLTQRSGQQIKRIEEESQNRFCQKRPKCCWPQACEYMNPSKRDTEHQHNLYGKPIPQKMLLVGLTGTKSNPTLLLV